MPAEIRAKIGVDTSDLGRAENAVRNFEGKLREGFRREPGRRGATAIEQSIQQISSGNIGGAIEAVTSKFSGLGLVGSASISLIAVGLAKVIEQSHEWEKAMKDAESVMNQAPAAGASMALLQKHIEDVTKAEEEMGAKAKAMWTYFVPLGEFYRSAAAAQSAKLGDEFVSSLERQVEKSRQLAAITELAALGFKKEAAAMKEQMEVGEKLADIHAKAQKMLEDVHKKPKEERQQEKEAIKKWQNEQQDLVKKQAADEAKFRPVASLLERGKLTRKEMGAGEGLLEDRLREQQAQKAERIGDAFKRQGYAGMAAQQYGQADMWRSQMVGLKEAEKPGPEIAAAISNAQVFQDILSQLEGINKGVGDISFGNL